MEAYRVGFRAVWDAVLTESANPAAVTVDALGALTSKVQAAQQVYTDAMAVGDRDEQTRRLARDQSQRSDLIDARLHGRLIEQWGLWEAAAGLGLPSAGPYRLIAAEAGAPGTERRPTWSPNCAALTCYRPGGGCPTCPLASCTCGPTSTSATHWH